ncbi:hypothetical protein BDV10DRAFT_126119 [Aspergillus recurvatus]
MSGGTDFRFEDRHRHWLEKRVIFEDDGSNIRSASAAVLVPIEPDKGASKEAMLFVTGFISRGIITVKADLSPNL